MRLFIALATVVFLAAIGWGGYWFIGSSAVERSLNNWLQDRRAEGWQADVRTLQTRGFPSRFDTTITGLELADPETGLAWQLPRLEILALSYRPNHIIAMLTGPQVLATPQQRITVTSDSLRGSVVFVPDTDLTLDRANFELSDITLASTLSWDSALESGRIGTRRNNTNPLAHDIAFEAISLRPSDALRSRLDPAGLLPPAFSQFGADVTATFTAPWDRHAVETARPQLSDLDIRQIRASWGDLELRATGRISVDTQGMPSGEITLNATNWRDMIEIARNSGALPEGMVGPLTSALEFLARLSGDSDTLNAPLAFRDGRVMLGPIPLGEAPRLILR